MYCPGITERRFQYCLAFAAVSALWTAPASAQQTSVELDTSACPLLDGDSLEQLIALELETLALTASSARLSISCDSHVATLILRDAGGRVFPVQVRVELGGTRHGARERLVALSVTELMAQAERAGWETAQPSEPSPSAPAAKRELDVESPRSASGASAAKTSRPELFAGVSGSLMGKPSTVLLGGGLGAHLPLSEPWGLMMDVRLERGVTATALADVDWTLLSGSLALFLETRSGAWRFGAGAGLRAARLLLSARAEPPDAGQQLSGVWLGAALPLRAAFELSGHVALSAGLESGYVIVPLRGTVDDGTMLVEARGPWATMTLGAAAMF